MYGCSHGITCIYSITQAYAPKGYLYNVQVKYKIVIEPCKRTLVHLFVCFFLLVFVGFIYLFMEIVKRVGYQLYTLQKEICYNPF